MKRSAYFLQSQNSESLIPIKLTRMLPSTTNLSGIVTLSNENSQQRIRLGDDFFNQESPMLARELLGKILVRKFPDGKLVCGRVVETEAYLGPIDKAAHSSCLKSVRTEPMFMKPGTVYVFSIYGMYHCMNVSSGGEGAAVLFRAVEPIAGIEKMQELRCSRNGKERTFPIHQLCNGPSKICLSYGVDKSFNKEDLTTASSHMWIEDWEGEQSFTIVTSTRIGLSKKAEEWIDAPLRFYVKGCRSVSMIDKKAEAALEL